MKLNSSRQTNVNEPASQGVEARSKAPGRQATPQPSVPRSRNQSLVVPRWGGKKLEASSVAQPAKTPAARWKRFELVAPKARTVFLAGTFNHWNPTNTPMMRLHDGKWAKELRLPAGRYEYLFVVDGGWTPDPKATDYAPNPFGGCNSVLLVEPSMA